MNSIQYLAGTALSLYMMILMLRMWFQYCQADFYHPISQGLVRITDPVLNPLRKTLPTIKNIDLSAPVFVFVLGFIKLPLLYILGGSWTAEAVSQNWGIYMLIGLFSVLHTFGEMLLYIIFFAAILSWFNRGNDLVSYLLYQLSEPVLAPLRKILPKTGMFDFSPMALAFILLFANHLMYDLFPLLWALV